MNNAYNSSNGLKRILFKVIRYVTYERYLNLGQRYNLDIGINSCGDGLKIWHTAGGVVINPHARIGTNLTLHGCNCIGNDGIHSKIAPRIGNNVHLGFGACVIGDVTLADDIWVAAGAVVVTSFDEPGIVIGGIPAKKLNKNYDMKVTICIPVYNVEKYIRRCLESVGNQTHKDLEIIVVNDCTPDNSMRIVEEIASKDKRVRIIEHDKNRGLMMARRTAYLAATGDYVMFCDSDDYLPLNAVEILLSGIKDSNVDIVSANHFYIDKNNKCKSIISSLKYGGDSFSIYKSLLKGEMVHNLWAKIYKRSLLQDYEYISYDNFTNGEDAFLFYQLVKNAKKMIHLDASVYYYMQNMESSTQRRLNDNAIKSICLLNKLRIDLLQNEAGLQRYLKQYVTSALCSLLIEGYSKDTKFKHYIQEYSLASFVTNKEILKNCSPKKLLLYYKYYFFNR